MKNDLTTRAWQHNIGCPISITLLSTSDGWLPKASALGPTLSQGVPLTEPGAFGRRRIYRCRSPKDPPQMGLVIHWHCSQSGWRCGEFTHNVRTARIVAFFVKRPFDLANFPMLASIRKQKKCCQKTAFLFPYPSSHPHHHHPLNRRLTLIAGWAPMM